MKGRLNRLSDSKLAKRIQKRTSLLDSFTNQPNCSNTSSANVDGVRRELRALWTEFVYRVSDCVDRVANGLSSADYSISDARADVWVAIVLQLPTVNVRHTDSEKPEWDANIFVARYASIGAPRIRALREWNQHGTITNIDVIRARFVIDRLHSGGSDTRLRGEKPISPIRDPNELAGAVAKEFEQNRDNHHRLSAEQISDYLVVRRIATESDFQSRGELSMFDLLGHVTVDVYESRWYTVLAPYVTARELAILRHLYGIETEQIESRAEVGALLGISARDVSRAHQAALRKLRTLGRINVQCLLFDGCEPEPTSRAQLSRSEVTLTA